MEDRKVPGVGGKALSKACPPKGRPKEKEIHCQLDWGILILQNTYFYMKVSVKSCHKEILLLFFF